MKTIRILLLVMLLSITAVYAEDSNIPEPDTTIKSLVDQVLSSLKEDKELIRNRKKLEEYVATRLLDHFDFTYMSKQTVGEKQWESATTQERSSLVDEYRTFMANIFTNSLSQYESQSVTFAPFHISPEATNALVKSKLNDPTDETLEFDFKLEKTSEGWMIYDIELGGIGLVRTYKSNFSSVLRDGGVSKLISELHKKNQDVRSRRL